VAQPPDNGTGEQQDVEHVRLPEEMSAKVDELLLLSMERNIMASENAYAAWLRAGGTLLVAGLAVRRLAWPQADPPLIVLITTALLLVTGAGVFVISLWVEAKGRQRLRHLGIRSLPLWVVVTISLLLLTAAILGLFIALR